MKVFPTLQIENGLTVPFFGESFAPSLPMEMLERLMGLGCTHITFVDRDAAMGKGNNRELIIKLVQRFLKSPTKVCIQVGGGIRGSDQAQLYLDHGVSWILVNAIVRRSPMMAEQLVARFQSRLTATLTARGGELLEVGQGPIEATLEQAVQYLKVLGIRRTLFIDLPDGKGSQPDFRSVRRIAELLRSPLLMSGTLSTEEHVHQAAQIPGLQGVLLDAWDVVGNPKLVPHSTQPCA